MTARHQGVKLIFQLVLLADAGTLAVKNDFFGNLPYYNAFHPQGTSKRTALNRVNPTQGLACTGCGRTPQYCRKISLHSRCAFFRGNPALIMMDRRGIIMRNWGKFSLVEGEAIGLYKSDVAQYIKGQVLYNESVFIYT